jgi:tetratricopeptide (TPR) repeat protein
MAFWPHLFGRAPAAPPGAAEPRKLRIFISYGHEPRDQAALVRQIGRDLGAKHSVWFDEIDIRSGDHWRRAIIDGLTSTDWTLAFLSAHAMRPGSVCLNEIAWAMNSRRGNVATVLLEPEREVRVPVSIGHIQWLDMSGWRAEQAKGRRAWRAWYDARLGEIRAMLTDPLAHKFTGEIEALSARLHPLSQSALVARLIDGFVGREWLAEQVNDWRLNRPAQRMLLLTAAAGVGKSAFAAWLTHYARANVVGLTISRADDAESRSAANVVRTLALQIATRLPDFRRPLLDLLARQDPDGKRLDTMEPVPLFRFLLAEPLRLIDGGRVRDRFVVVADGLDETLAGDRCPLADLFAQHAGELPDWIAVLLTSRPHHEIERALSQLEPLRIETQAANNLADIRDYAERWLAATDLPAAERGAAVQRVIEAAGGNFQYLVVLRQEVEQGRVSLASPARLPQGLVGLYRVWMDRQFPDRAAYEEWRTLLAVLAVAHNPVPEALLGELLGWDAQRKAHMLEQIEGLFERRGGNVAPAHDSLREWLTTEQAARSDFWVQAESGRVLLANALWEKFVAWMGQADAKLDWFLVAELPAQLAREDVAQLRDRLATAGPWPTLAERLRAVVGTLEAGNAWAAVLAWLGLIEHLCEATGDDALGFRSATLDERGNTLMLLGASGEASAAYQAALDIHQTLAARDPGNTAWQRGLSVSHNKLGDVLEAQGNLAGALEAYRNGLAIMEALAARDPDNTQWQRGLSFSHGDVGDVLMAQGNLPGALETYRKGLAIGETLAAGDPGDTEWQRNLSASHNRLANVLEARGNLPDALEAYRKSLAISDALAAGDPGNAQWQLGQSVSHEMIGDVLVAEGDLPGALEAYQKGLAIRETLAARDPGNTGWQRALSVSHSRLGNVLMVQGNLPGALEAFRNFVASSETLAMRDPSNAAWQDDLAVSHSKLGDVLVAQGKLLGALEAYRKGLAIRETQAARDPGNTKWQRGLSVSHQRIGNMFRSQGDLLGALTAYREALVICRRLVLGDPTVTDWQFGVANNLERVADILERQGNLRGALDAYQEVLPVRERLSASGVSNASYASGPAGAHVDVGRVLLRLGQTVRAREAAEAAVVLARDAQRRFPEGKTIAHTLRAAEALLDTTVRGNPLSGRVVGFDEPVVPAPAPLPDPRVVARAALVEGQAAQALASLEGAPDDGRTRNLRAVCLLRLGLPEEAREALHPALFPNGGAQPEETTPDSWIINYATAQFLSDDARACRRSLDWVKNANGRGVVRLRQALDNWERATRSRGAPQPKPSLSYTPGEV